MRVVWCVAMFVDLYVHVDVSLMSVIVVGDVVVVFVLQLLLLR